MVRAARKINGALPFEEVKNFAEDRLQRVDDCGDEAAAKAPALSLARERGELFDAEAAPVRRGQASNHSLAEIVLRKVVNYWDGDERRQAGEHGVRDEYPLVAGLRSL